MTPKADEEPPSVKIWGLTLLPNVTNGMDAPTR